MHFMDMERNSLVKDWTPLSYILNKNDVHKLFAFCIHFSFLTIMMVGEFEPIFTQLRELDNI